jgi:hypothetical protein
MASRRKIGGLVLGAAMRSDWGYRYRMILDKDYDHLEIQIRWDEKKPRTFFLAYPRNGLILAGPYRSFKATLTAARMLNLITLD